MSDPMLAKAAALEEELLRIAKMMGGWPSSPTLERAALLIQQLRVRLESLQRDGVE